MIDDPIIVTSTTGVPKLPDISSLDLLSKAKDGVAYLAGLAPVIGSVVLLGFLIVWRISSAARRKAYGT